MAIGERIRFIRNLRGITQKELGKAMGFDDKNADNRVGQYESGTRTPKENLVKTIADILGVSTKALELPDIDDYVSLMHTFFALEDLYGVTIAEIDGEVCLRVNRSKGMPNYLELTERLTVWQKVADKYRNDLLSKEEYDKWRYSYPKFDMSKQRNKPISGGLNDMLIEAIKEDEYNKKHDE